MATPQSNRPSNWSRRTTPSAAPDQVMETIRRSPETSTPSGAPSAAGTEQGEVDRVRGLARREVPRHLGRRRGGPVGACRARRPRRRSRTSRPPPRAPVGWPAARSATAATTSAIRRRRDTTARAAATRASTPPRPASGAGGAPAIRSSTAVARRSLGGLGRRPAQQCQVAHQVVVRLLSHRASPPSPLVHARLAPRPPEPGPAPGAAATSPCLAATRAPRRSRPRRGRAGSGRSPPSAGPARAARAHAPAPPDAPPRAARRPGRRAGAQQRLGLLPHPPFPRRPPARRAVRVACLVGDDPQQPRAKRCTCAEAVEGGVRLDEGLLDDILGIGAGPEQGGGTDRHRGMTRHQLGVRVTVAAAHPGQDLGVLRLDVQVRGPPLAASLTTPPAASGFPVRRSERRDLDERLRRFAVGVAPDRQPAPRPGGTPIASYSFVVDAAHRQQALGLDLELAQLGRDPRCRPRARW